MQKLSPGSRGFSSLSHGSLPTVVLGAIRQGVPPVDQPAAEALLPQPGQSDPAQMPIAVQANRAGSAPTARKESAAEASARRVSHVNVKEAV